jgi:alpha-tubulin suppressor-like RCC1 family protein
MIKKKKKALNKVVLSALMTLVLQCTFFVGAALGAAESPIGQWLFNEGTGTIAKDISESKNDGKIYGATFVEGKRGSALSFDGNDYVEIPHQASLSPRSAFSIAAWINPVSNTKYQKIIYKSLGSNTDYSIIQGGQNNIGFSFKTGINAMTGYTAANSVPSGTWTHVAGTYDGTRIKIYINGKQVYNSKASGTINMNAEPLRIGGGVSAGNNNFIGKVDDVYIYSRALTAQEVNELYTTEYVQPEPEIVKVTGVSLNQGNLALTVGQTGKLTATVTPGDAANKEVSWASSKPAVATVDGAGNIRAVAAGTAKITVTTLDGGFTANCLITVQKPEPVVVKVTGVSLNKGELALTVGQSEKLTAAVSPSNAANKEVSWASSKPAVATVDGAGNIRAVAAGTAKITVTTLDGAYTASCMVNVQQKPAENPQPAAPQNLFSLAGGAAHSAKINANGTVSFWGDNLGTSYINGSNQVKILTGVIALSSLENTTLALKSDGTVWAWGYNATGQLGDGTKTNRKDPVQVKGLTGVKAVAAGCNHSLALKNDGTVWAWGYNGYGQLGTGTTTNSYIPVKVKGLTNVVQIQAGRSHSIALKADGTVWGWGYNGAGHMADGTNINRLEPIQIQGLSDIVWISSEACTNYALKADGTLWAWGVNRYGTIGDGTSGTSAHKYYVVQLPELKGVVSVATGRYHTLFLKNDGTVWSTGNNGYGQLGIGNYTSKTKPVQVQGLANIVGITCGERHSFAVSADGTIYAWGANEKGQLGDGTTTTRVSPVKVSK